MVTRFTMVLMAWCLISFWGCNETSTTLVPGLQSAKEERKEDPAPVPPPAAAVTPAAPASLPLAPPPSPFPLGGLLGGGGFADGGRDQDRHHGDINDAPVHCGDANAPLCDGYCPQGQQCVANNGDCLCLETPRSSLFLQKTANVSFVPEIGEIITYNFVVQNGPVALTNVVVDDIAFSGFGSLSPLICTPELPARLEPLEELSCIATYTIQPEDIGHDLTNTAMASGQNSACSLLSVIDILTIPSEATPSISLSKTAEPSFFAAVGDQITYTITALNGPLDLSDVQIQDSSIPLGSLLCESPLGTPVSQPFNLPANQALVCSGVYTINAQDVSAGFHNNEANVTGFGGALLVSDSAIASISSQSALPSISLVKSANPDTFNAIGQRITYTFTVQNGPVAVTNVTLTDPSFPLATDFNCSSPFGTPVTMPLAYLPAGQALICTGTYFITASDLAAGFHNNIANVLALAGAIPVSDTDSLSISAIGAPLSMSIVESANPPSFSAVGENIDYTIRITNGAQGLDNVMVSDPGIPLLSCESPAGTPIVLPLEYLPAGQQLLCMGNYAISASDLSAGFHNNSVSISGLDGITPMTSSDTLSIPSATAIASIDIVKSALPEQFINVGEAISYTITATNGPIALSNVAIGDASLPSLSCESPLGTPVTQPIDYLPAGQALVCTGTYLITPLDVVLGTHTNTAFVIGFNGATQITDSTQHSIVSEPLSGLIGRP